MPNGITTQFVKRIPTAMLAVLTLISVQAAAEAADPRASRMIPYGAQTGQEVTVTFYGDRLDDTEEVLCDGTGITISEVTVVPDKKGKQVTAKIAIAEDAKYGTRRLRLRTRSGLSEIVNFFVGPFAVVDEKEPNSEFETPQAISNNVTVHGEIANEDVDYYTVDLKKGERFSVEVEGLRLGNTAAGTFFDPYIAVLNSSRFELAAEDDHALTQQDAFVSLIIPEDGTYTIQVRDASYGGGRNAYYRLHVGNYARPSGVVPAGGRPGETVEVTFLGDPAGPFKQQVTFPAEPGLSFGAFPKQGESATPTCNPLWVSELDNVIEVEPNENVSQATPMHVPSAANGVVSSQEDSDYFKFSLKKNQEVDIDVIARRVRSSIDSVLDVYDSKGKRLAGDDDRKRPDSWVRFKAPADGEYVIRVRDQLGNGGPDYFYRVEVSPRQPELTITVNDISRYVQPDIVVPKGRRRAVLATVRRDNFGGAISISGEGLPEGVKVETPECWLDTGTIPLVFDATASPAPAGTYGKVKGAWQHPDNKTLTANTTVEQHYLRIRGRNNQVFWEEKFEEVPVVVTEEVPFDIQVSVPKVPLVRNGKMNLKVTATRAEGYDEEIRILILQNPPGVNSSRSIKIAKGKTEASIPFNASGNAPLKESMITVRALAKVNGGTMEICSPYFPITVAEPYMSMELVNVADEQGKEINLPVEIENSTPFEGKATVELLGLPTKTKTEPTEIDKDTKQIVFKIQTEKDAPVGETKNLFCRVIVTENGEPVEHKLGSGRLRINKPAPVVVAKKEEPKKKEPKKQEPKPKVLSRLEMLRQQQEALREQLGTAPASN